MIGLADRLVRPLLLRLDPETAHQAALALMRRSPLPAPRPDEPALAVDAFGLRFPNPVGLAAGFDKNAVLGEGALRFGFGFTEVGTFTPRPQSGNPRPRVFRLEADHGVINRYGFNNEGHEAAAGRLAERRRRGIVGVNIGANKDAADRTADYAAGLARFVGLADYFTLNVSSPNTPGLRDLQATAALDDLLARVLDARDGLAGRHGRRPVLLKIAPDLDEAALDDIVAVIRRHPIDGVIVSNTTLARPDSLMGAAAGEAGGLSGRPLFDLSTRLLAQAFLRLGRQTVLIGAGGIDSPATAMAKITAGASLVQLYSGLVYEGLGLVGRIKAHLADHLRDRQASLTALVGTEADAWARNRG